MLLYHVGYIVKVNGLMYCFTHRSKLNEEKSLNVLVYISARLHYSVWQGFRTGREADTS